MDALPPQFIHSLRPEQQELAHVVEGVALPSPVRHRVLLHPLAAPGERHVGEADDVERITTTATEASGLACPVTRWGPATAER